MTSDAKARSRSDGYRRWLFAAGLMLTVVSALYLGRYAAAHWAELHSTRIGPTGMAWAAVACALYAGGLLLVGLGWLAAVRACRDSTPPSRVIGIALVSQMGKYVPGNVAQHIGKAVYGGSRGMSLQVVAKSTLFEITSMTIAGGFVAVVGSASSPIFSHLSSGVIGPLLSRWHYAVFALLALGGLSLILLVPRVALLRRSLSFAPRPAAATLALHIMSITLLGLSFYAVATAFAGGLSIRFCVALFSAAWLLGFLTPGAPAGLGIRETILVMGLSGPLGPMALPAAILHRVVSALADAITASVGIALLRANKGSLSAPPALPASEQAES